MSNPGLLIAASAILNLADTYRPLTKKASEELLEYGDFCYADLRGEQADRLESILRQRLFTFIETRYNEYKANLTLTILPYAQNYRIEASPHTTIETIEVSEQVTLSLTVYRLGASKRDTWNDIAASLLQSPDSVISVLPDNVVFSYQGFNILMVDRA